MDDKAQHDHKDDDEGGPEIPAGVLKQSRGWAGEELELEHRREQLRATTSTRREKLDGDGHYAAVDLRQFQNTEVGRGYQAKHVVRQRSAGRGDEHEHQKVTDMTTRKGKQQSESTLRKRLRVEDSKVAASPKKQSKEEQLEQYLQCEGLRTFRLEIERILQSER